MNALAQGFYEAGLVQFGRFEVDGAVWPLRTHFDYLGSYPDLLLAVAQELTQIRALRRCDRLLCPIDALPLTTLVGAALSIPVVWAEPHGAQWTLHGAYDIGHPSALILNQLDHANAGAALIKQARRVGLATEAVYAVFDLQTGEPPHHNAGAILTLDALLENLRETGILDQRQSDLVRAWRSSLSAAE